MQSEPLSREFLLARGSCCGSECLNCPYMDESGNRHVEGAVIMKQQVKSETLKVTSSP